MSNNKVFILEGILEKKVVSVQNNKSLDTLFANDKCPKMASLIDEMPDIVYQGDRKTCVSLATVALLEYYFKGAVKLSSQFLYWIVKLKDGSETKLYDLLNKYKDATATEREGIVAEIDSLGGVASDFKLLKDVLEKAGTCEENLMPYAFSERVYSQGQCSLLDLENCKANALNYRVRDEIQLMQGNAVDTFRNRISGSDGLLPMPVLFTIPVFYTNKEANAHRDKTGWFSMPPEGLSSDKYHTMLAVGYVDTPMSDGGGYIIARNSWGATWGANLAKDKASAGYAKISYAYISQYASESALTIRAKNFAGVNAIEDEFSMKYTKITQCDMLNRQGRAIISKGDKIIFDKENALVDLYNAENKRLFKENGYAWDK